MAKDSTPDSKVDGLQKISKILLCFQKLNPRSVSMSTLALSGILPQQVNCGDG